MDNGIERWTRTKWRTNEKMTSKTHGYGFPRNEFSLVFMNFLPWLWAIGVNGVQEAAGSNPVTRTKRKRVSKDTLFLLGSGERFVHQRPLAIQSTAAKRPGRRPSPHRPLVQIQSLGPEKRGYRKIPSFFWVQESASYTSGLLRYDQRPLCGPSEISAFAFRTLPLRSDCSAPAAPGGVQTGWATDPDHRRSS